MKNHRIHQILADEQALHEYEEFLRLNGYNAEGTGVPLEDLLAAVDFPDPSPLKMKALENRIVGALIQERVSPWYRRLFRGPVWIAGMSAAAACLMVAVAIPGIRQNRLEARYELAMRIGGQEVGQTQWTGLGLDAQSFQALSEEASWGDPLEQLPSLPGGAPETDDQFTQEFDTALDGLYLENFGV